MLFCSGGLATPCQEASSPQPQKGAACSLDDHFRWRTPQFHWRHFNRCCVHGEHTCRCFSLDCYILRGVAAWIGWLKRVWVQVSQWFKTIGVLKKSLSVAWFLKCVIFIKFGIHKLLVQVCQLENKVFKFASEVIKNVHKFSSEVIKKNAVSLCLPVNWWNKICLSFFLKDDLKMFEF